MFGASTIGMREAAARFPAGVQVRERAFGAREVDEHVRAAQGSRHVGADVHAVPAARRDVQGRCELDAFGCAGRFEERAAHSAAGPGDRDPHGAHRRGGSLGPAGAESAGWASPLNSTTFSSWKSTVKRLRSSDWLRPLRWLK
jgi:hypothetical protein